MPIRLHEGSLTRLFSADPGQDSRFVDVEYILDERYDPRPPWRDLGIAQGNPLLTIRASLRSFVFDAAGRWEDLEHIGVDTMFSLALIQVKDGQVLVNLAPASLGYMQIRISGGNYRGHIYLDLLGEMRVVEGP